MSKNLKSGDICLVIGAKFYTENIGKTVTLIQYIQPGQRYTCLEGLSCNHPSHFPPAWEVQGAGIKGRRTSVFGNRELPPITGSGLCLAKNLMPLRGEPEAKQEKIAEKA